MIQGLYGPIPIFAVVGVFNIYSSFFLDRQKPSVVVEQPIQGPVKILTAESLPSFSGRAGKPGTELFP